MTFRALMDRMLDVIHRRRLVLGLPFWVARILAFFLDLGQTLTAGLIGNALLTRDQVKNLRNDNVVAEGAKGFADLGITPTSMETVMPEYLWRFRPSGQYDAIKGSARNLKI